MMSELARVAAPKMTKSDRESFLIVDDDDVFRTRLARALEHRGFEVRTAADVDAAIALATEESPEKVIVDLKMPKRSGLEFVGALKKIDATTKVIVLTGFGSIATAVDAMRLGATSYLAKPADVDDILNAFARDDAPPLSPEKPRYSKPSLARLEWEHINQVLSDCGGNISETARQLGLHRRSLQRKLRKYAPK